MHVKEGICVVILFCICDNGFGIQLARKLPNNLKLAIATSAYQVEGAWNEGRGESIWDRMVHTRPDKIVDGSNGDIACDSYHKTESDVILLKDLGVQKYRFSISWSRILPYGYSNIINDAGVAYYNKLINKLLLNGITPMVTLYHFDLPQVFQDFGGWTNPQIVKWFEDYARVVFDNFGDRVKDWITINEPKQICRYGYGDGGDAPGLESGGLGVYMCTRNILLAHASVYHLYKRSFQNLQAGRLGISIECPWSEPGSDNLVDVEAAERNMQFDFGLYAHPVFSTYGDFPSVVKEFVANRSKLEGFTESRLPTLSKSEIEYIRGTSDFFGLNYYTAFYVTNKLPDPVGLPSMDKDIRVKTYQDPNWLDGAIYPFKSVPWAFRKILNFIKLHYGNREILVTENGFPDLEEFNDTNRIKYHTDHLVTMLNAIQIDEVNITTYTTWALMDNFEWASGYTARFGVYHVDFNSLNQTRTPKASYNFFKNLIETRSLTYNPDETSNCLDDHKNC